MLSSSCFTCLLLLRITIMFKKCCIGLFFGLCQTIIIWKGTFLVFIVIFRFLLVACQVKKKKSFGRSAKKEKRDSYLNLWIFKENKDMSNLFSSSFLQYYTFFYLRGERSFLLSFGVKRIDNRVMWWMNFDIFIT